MIMYTTMPGELMYPISQDIFEKQQLIHYNGIPVMVTKNEAQEYEVIRILSTDPNHFLHAPIQPGAKIPIL